MNQESSGSSQERDETASSNWEKVVSKETVQTFMEYAKENKLDTVSYCVLVLGVIYSFFDPLWGGAIVGAMAGLYFSPQILRMVQGSREFIEGQGLVKSAILIALFLLFFYAYPLLFVSLFVFVGVKQLLDPLLRTM